MPCEFRGSTATTSAPIAEDPDRARKRRANSEVAAAQLPGTPSQAAWRIRCIARSVMGAALETTFHGMSSTMWLEAHIETWVARLERSCGRILRCSVLVDKPRDDRADGTTFLIRVNLSIPGRQFAISRNPDCNDGDADVYRAVSDVFRMARRQLQEHAYTTNQSPAPT